MKTISANGQAKICRKRVASLKPSPENQELYGSTDDDPDIGVLAESIRKFGLREPLTITIDNYIVSGNRRRAALLRIGQQWAPCRVLSVSRDGMSTDEFIALIREYNRQRNKTVADQVREELVDVDPEAAFRNLREHHLESLLRPELNGVQAVTIEGRKKRPGISDDKTDHVKYILKIVEARRDYWPLSVRGVHYPLLNHDFIRGHLWPHAGKPGHGQRQELRYENDDGSYQATSDLITRLRINGILPWEAFDDFTRPFEEFRAFRNVRQFIRQEMRKLLRDYWRHLVQTQPAHIETACEKNTVYHMARKVARKYLIPISSGRGFNSVDPWHDLYVRYLRSGKQRLIVIVISDWDPEGEMIPQVCGRTLLEFGVPESDLTIIKAGVTAEQIAKYNLPAQKFAKESSTNWDWFVNRNNGNDAVYEVEALNPPDMLADFEHVIKSVIDIDLFNKEIAMETKEARYLKSVRTKVVKYLKELLRS
jgi:hypothetical protein